MAISVTKSGPYFTSGAISFSAMRNTFRLNNPTGTISASELLRNTDLTNADPILPDATENNDVATTDNWKTSQIRDSIKFYNLTIDVSGDIFGCGADATVTGPDGLDGGDAREITGGGNNIKINLQSTGRIYAGGGAGEHGAVGSDGQSGTCFDYIFQNVNSGCGFCGDCSSLGSGYTRIGGCNGAGGCNCAGWGWWYGCRQTNLTAAECRKQENTTVVGGTGGAGGVGGRGRGFNFQSGSIAGATGSAGGAFAGCSGFTGTVTAGSQGNTGETGGNGGEWGESGSNTSNTGDGGDPGKAITPTGFTVTGTVNSSTIKGSY